MNARGPSAPVTGVAALVALGALIAAFCVIRVLSFMVGYGLAVLIALGFAVGIASVGFAWARVARKLR